MGLVITWLFFVSFISSYGEISMKAIIDSYAVAAGISAASGLTAYFGLFNSTFFNTGRPRLMFGFKDANVYGPFLLFISLVAVAKLEVGKFRERVIWCIMFLACITAIFLSFSRGAWLNIVVAFATYMILRTFMADSIGRIFRRVLYVASIIIIAAILLNYILIDPEVSETLVNRLQFLPYDTQRFSVQSIALSEVVSNPLAIGTMQARYRYSIGPHNIFIGVLIEYALIGGFSFIALILITLFRAFMLIARGEKKWYWLFQFLLQVY